MWMEKREFKRCDCRLPLYYRRLDQLEFINSETRNISEGGMKIALKDPESIDRVLQLKVFLSENREVVDAMGRIKWVKKDSPQLEAGIEIMDLGTGYRDKVKAICR